MRGRIKRLSWRVVVLVSCGWLSHLPVARAQEIAVEGEAKAEFELGVRAASTQDYAAAREHFMRSRQLVVKASTLLNLAIADLKLGLYDEAVFALDAIEAPEPGPEQSRLRQRARKLRGEIAALRENVARARADGPVPAEAPPQMVDDSAQPALNDEHAPPTEPQRATVAPVAELVAPPRQPSVREHSLPAPSLRGARTLLALGGALGLGALGSTLWWYDRHVAHDRCLNEREVYCAQKRAIGSEKTAATAATIALGAAAASLVVGGAIWLVSRKETRVQRVSVSLGAERRALGLIASASF